MSGRELFSAMVRTIGLIMTIYGVFTLIALLFAQIAVPEAAASPFTGASLSSMLLILIGGWFLRRSEAVVRFAYPNER